MQTICDAWALESAIENLELATNSKQVPIMRHVLRNFGEVWAKFSDIFSQFALLLRKSPSKF